MSGIAAGADDDAVADCIFRIRKVGVPARRIGEMLIFYGGDNADDGVPGFVIFRRSEADAFADGAGVRPIIFGEALIDDGDGDGGARIVVIVFGEIAAFENREFQARGNSREWFRCG